jgi:hypothetical protein
VLDQFIVTIDNLRQYPNMLAFNIGNEVVTGVNNTNTLPFVKAAARDVKAYLRSVKSSALVGYASTDGDENSWRDATANYLTCDSDATSIDLYGLSSLYPSSFPSPSQIRRVRSQQLPLVWQFDP